MKNYRTLTLDQLLSRAEGTVKLSSVSTRRVLLLDLKARHYRCLRDRAFDTWTEVMCVQTVAWYHNLLRIARFFYPSVNNLTMP